MSVGISKGDTFVWSDDEDDTMKVHVTVVRVARDGTWADLRCTVGAGINVWGKRQRLPLPSTFRRVPGGAA